MSYIKQIGDKTTATYNNTGGKLSATLKNMQGKKHTSGKADEDAQTMVNNEETQYEKNQDYSKDLANQDSDFLQHLKGNNAKYQGDLDALKGETQLAQMSSDQTYSNQIQPRLKNLMESAQKNSASAMSLQDAMDPNNPVAAQTRALYAKQAQNENRASLANTGTMQALGMQNMAGQLGNAMPMTGGQLQALMGANQAQSGAAYARSQQRVQQLQDQGLQQGYDRSDKAYSQGQDAQNTYRNRVGDYEDASNRQENRDKDYRSQRAGYSNQGYNLQNSMAEAERGVNSAGTQRDMAIYNTHMGGKQANIAGQIQGINAKQAADAAQTTGLLQAGGTAVGAYFGGPAGAAAGNQAGAAAGAAAAPDANAVPAYGNYNQQPTMQQQQMGIQTYQNQGGQQNMPMPPDEGGSTGLRLTGGGSSRMPARGGGTGGGGFQANPYAYQAPQSRSRGGGRGARA